MYAKRMDWQKSSRNTYLNDEERKAALILSKSLMKGKALLETGETDAAKLRTVIANTLDTESLAKVDYVEVVDWDTLEPVETIDGSVLTAIAVYIGTTRLIDNFIWQKETR